MDAGKEPLEKTDWLAEECCRIDKRQILSDFHKLYLSI